MPTPWHASADPGKLRRSSSLCRPHWQRTAGQASQQCSVRRSDRPSHRSCRTGNTTRHRRGRSARGPAIRQFQQPCTDQCFSQGLSVRIRRFGRRFPEQGRGRRPKDRHRAGRQSRTARRRSQRRSTESRLTHAGSSEWDSVVDDTIGSQSTMIWENKMGGSVLSGSTDLPGYRRLALTLAEAVAAGRSTRTLRCPPIPN